MKQLHSLVFSLLLLSMSNKAQTTFQKNYGGSSGCCAQQTLDGGYVVAGTFFDTVYVVKTDVNGNTTWRKTIGFKGSNVQTQVRFLKQTSDSGYVIGGIRLLYDSTVQGGNVYLLKLNSSGNVKWMKADNALCIAYPNWYASFNTTSDKGFIIAGMRQKFCTQGDMMVYLYKTDSAGNGQWMRTYSNPVSSAPSDHINTVLQTSDGGYILAGNIVIRTDLYGKELWFRLYSIDVDCMIRTRDGGYLLGGSPQAGLCKLTASGNLQWTYNYGAYTDHTTTVQELPSCGYIAAGTTYLNDPAGDLFVLHTDSTGDTLKIRAYGGHGSGENATSVASVRGGNYLLGGNTSAGGILLMTLDSALKGPCTATPASFPVGLAAAFYHASARDTASGPGFSPLVSHTFVNEAATSTQDFCFTTGIAEQESIPLLNIFPNPGDGLFTVSINNKEGNTLIIRVSDIVGRTVYQSEPPLTAGLFTVQMDLQTLTAGTYIMQVWSKGLCTLRKLCISR
ncbi:MAG: T9SS type A sorting domain-containing protein [Bacteroidia bacterium]